mgnify:CR=1 FL=1
MTFVLTLNAIGDLHRGGELRRRRAVARGEVRLEQVATEIVDATVRTRAEPRNRSNGEHGRRGGNREDDS